MHNNKDVKHSEPVENKMNEKEVSAPIKRVKPKPTELPDPTCVLGYN